ncbi:Sjoegren syndrome nuclear autoantigen 1 homolog isoform X2 [Zootermopsis nevadensis]|uniref:Sjoegren syndrome nuclear autoantigen 1 homolog isoform X2 n=1 Tax=Zootermopsis nevadensis TaxID=136037 RepID=UPI000B8E5119|nr:Sjoegren syndrome nuclear autoantigen 1 homolog isoform X2 [Zootermopsis nevadensis]
MSVLGEGQPLSLPINMAQQGAALQICNLELVKGIEHMKRKCSELQQLIDEQEEEKATLQREIEKMSYKLTQLNDSLSRKVAAKREYDRTISETEVAYSKILESSQVLLNMVQREASCLEHVMVKKINAEDTFPSCMFR